MLKKVLIIVFLLLGITSNAYANLNLEPKNVWKTSSKDLFLSSAYALDVNVQAYFRSIRKANSNERFLNFSLVWTGEEFCATRNDDDIEDAVIYVDGKGIAFKRYCYKNKYINYEATSKEGIEHISQLLRSREQNRTVMFHHELDGVDLRYHLSGRGFKDIYDFYYRSTDAPL
ncbi:exported hypothetical protein [Vibrio nigripulchritudo SOn1]|uniref:Uncharacterized protein n=1 Tax=Vibrio nigripulchritudo SOn1 TaxID=1238450 RepID=A0AAV2VPQ5_9VIBR|nr:hypothetical protein [Vibrio nigripulchritudo]CCO46710.1 exported hypothetical protein [Vibrio nigripulchritudo SOn1]